MDGSFGKSDKTGKRIYRRRGTGFLALPALVGIALLGLAITQPAASNWISEAAQAELAGANLAPEVAPTQLAQPDGKIRPVKACRLIRA